jgi:hypothetical protein
MARSRAWTKRTIGPWLGRKWEVYRVTDEHDCEQLGELTRGTLDSDNGKIVFRAQDRDGELLTLIHELIHPMAPRLSDTRERPEVDNLAMAVKSGLEAFGVDLSPMLRGYK